MKKIVPVVIIILICLSFYLNIPQRLYDRYILDNYNNYLSCDELPHTSLARERMINHRHEVEQMISEASGDSFVIWDSPVSARADEGNISVYLEELNKCQPDPRAQLVITYGGHQERVVMEKYLTNMQFHEIPVRLQNI